LLLLSHCFFLLGYPRTFATKTGLVDSKLGGSCGEDLGNQPGDTTEEEEAQEEEDIGAPIAGQPAGRAPAEKEKPTPKFKKATIEEIGTALEEVQIEDDSIEMRIKTAHLKDVEVSGEVVPVQDLLVLQVQCPPGAVLSTCTIAPSVEDTNLVEVSVDIDSSLSDGNKRVKKTWTRLHKSLAARIAASLSTKCKRDVIPGANHEREEVTVRWDDGIKSTLNPVDPFRLGLRALALTLQGLSTKLIQ